MAVGPLEFHTSGKEVNGMGWMVGTGLFFSFLNIWSGWNLLHR